MKQLDDAIAKMRGESPALSKRDILEDLLKKTLTGSEIRWIEKNWNAFYNEPEKYSNVSELVIDSLHEHRFEI